MADRTRCRRLQKVLPFRSPADDTSTPLLSIYTSRGCCCVSCSLTMSTPRWGVKRPLSSALSLVAAPPTSSAQQLTASFKSASPPPSSAAQLARCYPPDPAVYQSAVRSFYHSYRDVTSLWRQCNIDCTAAGQSVANGCLQLTEQCGSASGDWGIFARHPAVRQAVERETQKQIRSASDEANRCMTDLLDCYATLQSATCSLHSQHDQWINTAVLAASHTDLSEQQADDWLSCPLFDRGSCSMSDFLGLADELLAMHRKELTLKQAMLTHMLEIAQQGAADGSGGAASDMRSMLEQYMSCWTLEPFLQAVRMEEIDRVWQTECPAVATGSLT